MAEITASMVKELREKTDAPMMECKKALTEAAGDMAKAEEILRVKLGNKASKAATRIAAEGVVAIHVAAGGKLGSIFEINSETDFVAKNDEFLKLAADCAQLVAEKAPADVAVDGGADHAFGRHARGGLAGLAAQLDAQDLFGAHGVAVGFGQRLLALHHRCVGLGTQFGNHAGGNCRHLHLSVAVVSGHGLAPKVPSRPRDRGIAGVRKRGCESPSFDVSACAPRGQAFSLTSTNSSPSAATAWTRSLAALALPSSTASATARAYSATALAESSLPGMT